MIYEFGDFLLDTRLAMVPFEAGRELAALIPGARFVSLEGRNHVLLEHEPAWARFLAEVRSFLAADEEAIVGTPEFIAKS